jgi:hypothetical protein
LHKIKAARLIKLLISGFFYKTQHHRHYLSDATVSVDVGCGDVIIDKLVVYEVYPSLEIRVARMVLRERF